MLPAQRNKLTMNILGRLRQSGPPPAGGIKPFNPMDGTNQGGQQPGPEEDDLGRSPKDSTGQSPGPDESEQDQGADNNQNQSNDDLLQPKFLSSKKKRPTK